jgi:hypothetical protein
MTAERAAALVMWWVRTYSRGLPAAVARRRLEEIASDVHDHMAHERSRGGAEWRIALGIVSRMVRGVPADTAWRRRQAGGLLPAWARRLALGVAAILLVPAVAMRFSDEVAWTPSDFAVAGALLFGAGLALRLLAHGARAGAYRLAAALAVGGTLLLVWLVGAVGVVGADGDPLDLLYGAVLATGLVGAMIARLQPAGMARTLAAMALAQAGVTTCALLAGRHEAASSSVAELIGLNAMFVVAFAASARLFRRAARAT